jgi:tartrate-resistant acid phosphatase type 5
MRTPATALLGMALTASAANAQQPRRLDVHADTLTAAMVGLSPATKAAASAYVTGPDAAARNALGALRADPAALRFVLTVLTREPTSDLRRNLIGIIQSSQNPARLDVRTPLQAIVRTDRDTTVLKSAIEALRTLALRETQLPAMLAERIASARAANDTALVALLLEADESFAHQQRPIYAPAFIRTPPSPFPVETSLPTPFRVLAFGDYGTAHLAGATSHQAALAAVMRARHATTPFSFGLTTGDNFYPTSFPSPGHPGWKTAWDDQYASLGIPFYISLGNHDWAEPAGPMGEYIYALTSRTWRLPALYYTYTAGPAQFFALNTNALTERQLTWLKGELARSTARWKIVYGHFPVYEQTDYTVEPQRRLLLPILKEYNVDMYLAGHHHTVQHWQVDGIDYVVTGAGGAANYSLGDTTRANRARRFVASRPAFAELEVSEGAIAVRFVGIAPNQPGEPVVLYEYARRR